jgi:hypothetical protein
MVLLCFIRKSSGIARQSPLQGVCVSECNYKRGRTVGVEYLTAEGGKHKDRNGTSEKGRRGIRGVVLEGAIAVRGREGGEREIRQGVECYSPISTGVTLCLSFVNHSQPISTQQLWAAAGSHVGSRQLDSTVGNVRFASPRTLTSSTKHAGFSVPSDEDESFPNVTFP